MVTQLRGVFSAAATPIAADGTPDHAALIGHCRQLLTDGCHGVALLGSTGEANSFSMPERMSMLEAVVAGGVDPQKLLPGTGLCAVPDTVALTRHALSLGVTTVVMLPPFYYKGVSDQGLIDAYRAILDGIGDSRLKVVLYHIPPIAQVPITLPVIEALMARYPGTIVGVKDSGGDLANMGAMVRAFPDLAVFAGADPLMLPLLAEGGAGCITATSNLAAADLRLVFEHHADPARRAEVDAAQARVVATRTISARFAQIPTIKAMIARRTGEPGWARMRPPLVALTAEEQGIVGGLLDAMEAERAAA